MSPIRRTITVSEARIHLHQLLDEVEYGATLIITRHGRPIARLVPEEANRQAEVAAAIRQIQERRKHAPHVSVKEILLMRDEGRR